VNSGVSFRMFSLKFYSVFISPTLALTLQFFYSVVKFNYALQNMHLPLLNVLFLSSPVVG